MAGRDVGDDRRERRGKERKERWATRTSDGLEGWRRWPEERGRNVEASLVSQAGRRIEPINTDRSHLHLVSRKSEGLSKERKKRSKRDE
jgi:hypothetical protein